ncbi:HlyD family efflux transporter periplasmic adaptor subunit [Dysgonomonas sp. 216]|uniref:efflux RND transporter periplasmic adaptor subunit n=1 Tax=Dysgonomonas sp. 216 TaxID=2302934 RepID=UPI0013D7EE33|nr:HlyD family secretion protein [Dysgonomonas sp. 216]NDW18798.1 HlyD family efflux transporter periplasmic adaptor subunit [Dysgonomonas sp. 216]
MKKINKRKIHKYSLLPLLFIFFYACGEKETEQIPIGKVTKGTLYIDMHEEGEIEAVSSINLSSPSISWRYGSLKITEIVKDGHEVKAGDTLIVFDPSEVQKAIVEAEQRLEINKADLEKLIAQQQSDLEELRADYEVTRISQEISKIRFESAVYESDVKKREIQLNLEKADIALERAKEQIDNRVKIQKEEIKQKNLSIVQDQNRLQDAFETLKKLSVVTPSPGIAIISRNWSTNNKFQIGDQCWSGFPLIQLPDLSKLKATVKINEVDIAKISKGLKVEIKPDAFSDSVFTGTVTSVANLAVNKNGSSKIKIFPVEILLNETHKNLLPGLTVSCRLLVDKIDDVLYIPLDALQTEGDVNYVYKKTSGGYDKVEVKTGNSNSDYIIITEGLKENDNIALVNPFAAEKAQENDNATTETSKEE